MILFSNRQRQITTLSYRVKKTNTIVLVNTKHSPVKKTRYLNTEVYNFGINSSLYVHGLSTSCGPAHKQNSINCSKGTKTTRMQTLKTITLNPVSILLFFLCLVHNDDLWVSQLTSRPFCNTVIFAVMKLYSPPVKTSLPLMLFQLLHTGRWHSVQR